MSAKIVILSGLGVFIGIMSMYSHTTAGREEKPTSDSDKENGLPFAVVELFTSEGCSSCPPADALLGELVVQAERENVRIFALAFHVDYWDYIGWKDPFASADFSQRQRKYAAAFRSNRIYTPQMVVNGKHEFVGSDRSKARKYIDNALESPATVRIDLAMDESRDAGALHINYQLSGPTVGALLQMAAVERELVSKIKRGENRGRTLHHDNVVRAFKTVVVNETGSAEVAIHLPAGVQRGNTSVIVFAQDAGSLEILGAEEIKL